MSVDCTETRIVWVLNGDSDGVVCSPGPCARWDERAERAHWPVIEAWAIEAWIRAREASPGAIRIVKLGRPSHVVANPSPPPPGVGGVNGSVVVGVTRSADLHPNLAAAFRMRW